MSFAPKMSVTMSVPSRPADMAARLHNKFAKESLRETLTAHHQRTIGGHFEAGAAGKYGHVPRSEKYKERKRRKFGHDVDNVFSGATKREFSKPGQQTRIGGTAAGGTLTGKLTMKFPFSRQGQKRRMNSAARHARTRQRAREISAWTPAEARAAAEDFLKRYMQKVAAWRGSRKRKRLPKT